MAIYHFSAQMIGRSDGRSSVAASAYRSGQALTDERTGIECRYDRRRERIAHTEILAPSEAPAWATDRAALWNAVEASEKRKDAQVAREFEVSLPVELTEEQRLELTQNWAREQLVAHGLVVDISHHRDRADRNPHAHIMVPTRPIAVDGFGPKARHLNDRSQLDTWRASWAEHVNTALERAGHAARVDHRSLAAQGIDREPTIHEGYAAREMAARGQTSDRVAINAAQRSRNAERTAALDRARSRPARSPPAPAPRERSRSIRTTLTQRVGRAVTSVPRSVVAGLVAVGEGVQWPFRALAEQQARQKRRAAQRADEQREARARAAAEFRGSWQAAFTSGRVSYGIDDSLIRTISDRPELFARVFEPDRHRLPPPTTPREVEELMALHYGAAEERARQRIADQQARMQVHRDNDKRWLEQQMDKHTRPSPAPEPASPTPRWPRRGGSGIGD